MKIAFILCFAANIILLVVAYAVSPETVAIHFGPGGEAVGWASSRTNFIFMLCVKVFVFAGFYWTPLLIDVLPAGLINLPNKDYWLSDENKARAKDLISRELYLFGIATFAFLFGITALALEANLSGAAAMKMGLFWSALVLLMVFVAYWMVRMYKTFSVPGGADFIKD